MTISKSTVMSTTTMVAGWPDAVQCRNGTTVVTMYLDNGTTATGYIYHAPLSASGSYTYIYYNLNGTYNANGNLTGYDCVTNTWTIAQLYAAGRAFNFIGGASRWQDVAGFTYLTTNNVGVGVTVSSSAKLEVNGLVSATSGIIYGGLTVTGAVSASSVSATTISATIIQVGAGGTCAASVSGSIRYGAASNTLQICTGTGWVSLSSGTATASTAGATMQVQYNNNGSLGADANFTYTSATGLVSASLISTTYVQIKSATTVLACGASLTGTMRFTSGIRDWRWVER